MSAPMIVSLPDMDGHYLVMQALTVWTDDFGTAGKGTIDRCINNVTD
jgi:hypothetical protein